MERDIDKEDEAREVAFGIPAKMIRVRDTRLSGDPLIIGQAIAYGVDLLSTNNFRTIDHGAINRWLRERGRNADLLHTPDETMHHLDGTRSRWYGWMLAYGPWQPNISDEHDCREQFQRAQATIKSAGFKQLAEKTRWEYEADDRFMERVCMAVGNNPYAARAREAQKKIDRRVRAAARSAGWSR